MLWLITEQFQPFLKNSPLSQVSKFKPCSLLSLRNLPQVMQEPARQHTPLTFNRGFVHDCVSLLVRRAYTARSIDRIKEPPFLLNAEMCVNTIHDMQYIGKIFFQRNKIFFFKFFFPYYRCHEESKTVLNYFLAYVVQKLCHSVWTKKSKKGLFEGRRLSRKR